MSVVVAKIQTVEDIYRLIWGAIANKQPLSGIYAGQTRLFCPHRLGRNRHGESRVLYYQYGGDSGSGLAPVGSSANWRCVVPEKFRALKVQHDPWVTGPNHTWPANCIVEVEIEVIL